ncbi:MAG: transcription antitermination factor NusB [Actinomycetota bacterium]
MSEPAEDELLSAADAVRKFDIDRNLIDYWENSRQLDVVRTLRGKRYHPEQIAALAEQHRVADAAIVQDRPYVEPPPAEQPKTRSRARRTALEALHAWDVGGGELRARLDDPDLPYYARALIEGVAQHSEEIDRVIAERAEHWTIDRMPVVDRNVLRIGTFELLFTDVPTGVVVDEAVALARLLSTEDSGRFVNGLLGRVARERRPG